MREGATALAGADEQETPLRWHSQRTGGYRCEHCGYDTGKPEEYTVIPTRLLPEAIRAAIYGDSEPDANTLLCWDCHRTASQAQAQQSRSAAVIYLCPQCTGTITADGITWQCSQPHPEREAAPTDEKLIQLRFLLQQFPGKSRSELTVLIWQSDHSRKQPFPRTKRGDR